MDFKIHSFEIPRKGALLEGENGAWSEVSPLPGRSRETLSMAIDQLKAVQQGYRGPCLPSVAFGLYGLRAPYTPSIPCALLLMGPPNEVLKMAEQPHGCMHAKVKVGKWAVEEAIDVVVALTHHFTLRIDFNLAWKPSDVHCLCAHLPLGKIEFLEDPGCSVDPFPVLSDAAENPSVWKPTVCGLPEPHAPVILSSSFETSIGLHHIASLVHSHHIPPHILGLGTILYHEHDVVQNRAYLEGGRIHFPREWKISRYKTR